MIRCPGCGAYAQWGAPQCPACGATFAPPPAVVRPVPAQSEMPRQLPSQTGRKIAWLALFGIAALVAVWWLAIGRGAADPLADSSRTSALTVQPSGPKQEPEGDIFKVAPQAQQAPIIAIRNASAYPLCLTLQDSSGSVRTEWISVGETKDLTVPQGYYGASIAAPDDAYNVATGGTVDVKNFHHYEAEFEEVPAGESQGFYIGD